MFTNRVWERRNEVRKKKIAAILRWQAYHLSGENTVTVPRIVVTVTRLLKMREIVWKFYKLDALPAVA